MLEPSKTLRLDADFDPERLASGVVPVAAGPHYDPFDVVAAVGSCWAANAGPAMARAASATGADLKNLCIVMFPLITAPRRRFRRCGCGLWTPGP